MNGLTTTTNTMAAPASTLWRPTHSFTRLHTPASSALVARPFWYASMYRANTSTLEQRLSRSVAIALSVTACNQHFAVLGDHDVLRFKIPV